MSDTGSGPLPQPPSLALRTFAEHGLVRLHVGGEVDVATVGQLVEAGEEALLRHRPQRFEVDLAGVCFLDSSGINGLMRLGRLATGAGCTLAVINPQAQVRRVLDVTGIAPHLGLGGGNRRVHKVWGVTAPA